MVEKINEKYNGPYCKTEEYKLNKKINVMNQLKIE